MQLSAFVSAFRTPDLRKKLLFTLGIIALFRLGSVTPTPGVDYAAVQTCIASVEGNSLYGMINLFSGGALLQLSIFALGIMPYITASIILQLMTVVIPRLEALKKEGQQGQAQITQYTRYLTVALAILQSTGIVALARTPGQLFQGCSAQLIPDDSLRTIIMMVATMTAGTAVIMWLGELITDRGVGNGMSLLIFTSIISSFPSQIATIYATRGVFVTALTLVRRVLRHHGGGVRRAGPAPDPGAVRQADGGPQDVRRHVDLHPAEGEHGRRHPGHLRLVAAVPADPVRAVHRPDRAGRAVHPAQLPAGHRAALPAGLLRADHLLHVLLRLDHVQHDRGRGQHEEVRRASSRASAPAGPTAEYLDYVLSRLTLPGSVYLALHRGHPRVRLHRASGSQHSSSSAARAC